MVFVTEGVGRITGYRPTDFTAGRIRWHSSCRPTVTTGLRRRSGKRGRANPTDWSTASVIGTARNAGCRSRARESSTRWAPSSPSKASSPTSPGAARRRRTAPRPRPRHGRATPGDDLSERERIARRLADSEARYHALLEALPTAAYACDTQGRPSRLIGLSQDITVRRQVEEDLRGPMIVCVSFSKPSRLVSASRRIRNAASLPPTRPWHGCSRPARARTSPRPPGSRCLIAISIGAGSCKYSERVGLAADAALEGARAVVRAADSGIGIAPADLPRLFDLFVQAGAPSGQLAGRTRHRSGVGPGLVELHGGMIEAHSAGPGQGSEFSVRLPVLDESPVTPPGPPESPTRGPALPLRILFVDDNPDVADSLAMLLRAIGYAVTTAHDGLEAVEAAARERPDLVLLDLGMPKLDGYGACRHIRARPWGRDMRIVALAAGGKRTTGARSWRPGSTSTWSSRSSFPSCSHCWPSPGRRGAILTRAILGHRIVDCARDEARHPAGVPSKDPRTAAPRPAQAACQRHEKVGQGLDRQRLASM